jgi:hypothetical protein
MRFLGARGNDADGLAHTGWGDCCAVCGPVCENRCRGWPCGTVSTSEGAAVSTRPQLAQKTWPAAVGVPHCGQKRGRACAIVYLSPLLQINVQISFELIVT